MKVAEDVLGMEGLVCFWDFQEEAGRGRVGKGKGAYVLEERGGVVAVEEEGVFGNRSAVFGNGAWLEVTRAKGAGLCISGREAGVSVVAWVKRRRHVGKEWACQAVAGVWNEHGKRQYCLFLNLRIHESAEQVCAHVSGVGGPTEGFKYCMDAAIGATEVEFEKWECIAMSYDGREARAYVNGELDVRGERNPYAYGMGIFDGGETGADFTVGAVARPEKVEMVEGKPVESGSVQSNLFVGLMGGLAVFERTLSEGEMRELGRRVG